MPLATEVLPVNHAFQEDTPIDAEDLKGPKYRVQCICITTTLIIMHSCILST